MEFPMVNGANNADITGTDDVYSFNGNTLLLNKLNIKVTCMVNIYPAPIRSIITVESINGDAERVDFAVSDAVNSPEVFMKLLDYNYSLTVQQIYSISRYINDRLLPSGLKEYVSHGIGFIKGTRNLVYGGEVFYFNGVVDVKPVRYLPEFNSPKVMRRGSLAEYMSGIKKHVLGRVGLEFMLAFGLSGIIGSLISVGDIGRPILSIYGSSSQGKSTGARLAESISYRRTAKTLNMSMASFRKIIAHYGVVPIEYEDFNVNMNFAKKDIASFVLELFSTEQEDALCFSPIIITSVKSVSETTGRSGNVGQMARILEVNCMEDLLTDSGGHSRAIKNFTEENYGYVGFMVLEHLYKNKVIADLDSRYLSWLSKIEDGMGHGSAERLCNQLALYMLSAEVFNDSFIGHGIGLNIERLYEFILRNTIKQFNNGRQRLNLDKNIFVKILTECREQFVYGIPSDDNPLDISIHWGYVTDEYIFLRSVMLNERGHPILAQIAQNKADLMDAGLIVPNRGKGGKDSRVAVKIGVKVISDGIVTYKQLRFYKIVRSV